MRRFTTTVTELAFHLPTSEPLKTTRPDHVLESHPFASRSEWTVGTMLGDTIEIKGVLGEGNMSKVYEGHDRVLGRTVAVKVSKTACNDAWLMKEARVLATLGHASVVKVFSIGKQGGVPYMVMELVQGISLSQHMSRTQGRSQAISVRECVRVLSDIAGALSAVHRSGLAHRDIKPDNIVLAKDGRTMILDLGIAVAGDAQEEGQTIAGSPAYMPPEAVDPRSAFVAPRLGDIFSLGVLAYEMLTGRLPHEVPSLSALVLNRLTVPIDPISKTRSDVPADLEALIVQMLSVSQSDRPQSVEAILCRLADIERGVHTMPKLVRDILVVDDDAAIARLLSIQLRTLFPTARIRVASDGEQALEALLESPADLVLLDLQMPRVGGIEMFRRARQDRVSMQSDVIAVTAGAHEHDVQVLRELDIDHVILKGASMRERLASILCTLNLN